MSADPPLPPPGVEPPDEPGRELTPPGPQTSGRPLPPGHREVVPHAEPARPGIHWALVLVGVPIGFVSWVVGSFLVLAATGTMANSSQGKVIALVALVLLLVASAGLIVWRRTRRLAQGFVLGAAIGLVVAGGLCIPLVSSF